MDSTEATRFCVTCKVEKQLDEFEVHSVKSGVRHRQQCKQCRQEIKQGLRENRTQRHLREQLLKSLHATATSGSLPAFEEFLESVIGMLGGVSGAAELYVEAILTSYSESPGSTKTMNMLRDFAKLWQSHDSSKNPLGELADLTDEELNERLAKIAEASLSARGLRIVPMDDDELEVPHARVG